MATLKLVGSVLAGVAAATPSHVAPRPEVAVSVASLSSVKMTLPASIPPNPQFLTTTVCGVRGPSDSATCTATVVKAIDAARRVEPVGAIPSTFSVAAFDKLTYAEQAFAIADIERTGRGLPPIQGLTTQLNSIAATAAARQVDPATTLPLRLVGGGVATIYGSNWAEGTANALGADYYWMYDDGLNSPNIDCKRAGEAGCWGHRINVLRNYGAAAYCAPGSQIHLVMGAAEVTTSVSVSPSIAEIFTNDCGAAPTMYFTWAEVLHLVFGR